LFRRKPSADKRAQYRVEARPGAPLSVAILHGGSLVACELIDVTAKGCGLKTEAREGAISLDGAKVGDGQALVEGQELDLRFTALGVGKAVAIEGAIRRLEPGEGWLSLGLEFVSPEELYSQLSPKLWSFFNRRSGFRVDPLDAEEKRVEIEIKAGRRFRSLRMHDLSVYGCSVQVSKTDKLVLPVGSACEARMGLPGQEQELELALCVVHRTELQGGLRLGLGIDPEKTADYDRQHDELTRFVFDAQRAMLQRAKS
jgi:PilZ domain